MNLYPGFDPGFYQVLESISDAFFALDDNLVVTYFNNAAEQMLRRNREEVLGKKLFDVFPEARGSIFEEKYRYAIQHKASLSFETYFPISPYQNWYQVRVFPQRNGITVYFQVITEQVMARQNLLNAQQRLETVLQTISDAIVMVNLSGRVTYANRAAEELFNHMHDQLLTSTCPDCRWQQVDTELNQLPDDQIPLAQTLKRKVPVKDFQQGLITSSGIIRWLSVNSVPILGENQQITGAVASYRDITDQKERERRLLFQAQLLDTIGQAAIAVDQDGKILYLNRFCEFLFGYEKNVILGQPISEIFVPDEIQADIDRIRQTVRSGNTWNGELTLKRRNGAHFTAYCAVTPIEEKRRIIGYLIIAFDITERKWAEDTERELRALSEALRDTASAITSTLNFREVVERILNNVGKVVPHESANLMLLEEDWVKVVMYHGYTQGTSASALEGLRFALDDFPTLRKMYETRLPLVIPDTGQSTLWQGNSSLGWIKSYAGMPLLNRGQVIGFLNLDSSIAGFYTEEVIFRLQAFADQAALAVENARLYEEVKNLSFTDPLTGTFNRRGLFQRCNEMIQVARRNNLPVALAVLDLDNFKEINDTYGHALGDLVLGTVTSRLSNRLRPADVLGRYGGDEFVLLLTGIDPADVKPTLERLRQAITLDAVHIGEDTIFISVSIGASTTKISDYDLTKLLRHADHALYRVKKSVRNRAVMYSDLPE
ncbi:MAG: diguanylate cyclase [Bellilinea sp.]|jgi:diguanylate cyclase (GGDEF)-like protein/PAS domain S-box-containing protein